MQVIDNKETSIKASSRFFRADNSGLERLGCGALADALGTEIPALSSRGAA